MERFCLNSFVFFVVFLTLCLPPSKSAKALPEYSRAYVICNMRGGHVCAWIFCMVSVLNSERFFRNSFPYSVCNRQYTQAMYWLSSACPSAFFVFGRMFFLMSMSSVLCVAHPLSLTLYHCPYRT